MGKSFRKLFNWKQNENCFGLITGKGLSHSQNMMVLSQKSGKIRGGFNPKKFKTELLSAINIFDKDRFVGWKPRIRLVDGDVSKTFKKFLKNNPGVKILFSSF